MMINIQEFSSWHLIIPGQHPKVVVEKNLETAHAFNQTYFISSLRCDVKCIFTIIYNPPV